MHSRSVKLGRCLGSQDNLNFLKSLYFLLTMLSSSLLIVSGREMQGSCACDKGARPVSWVPGDRRPSCYECLKWVGTPSGVSVEACGALGTFISAVDGTIFDGPY